MPGRNLAPLAALTSTLLLAAPAAAGAATYGVDPKADAGCSETTCRTIGDALGRAAAGDTISLARGLYAEDGLDVAKDRITIEAVPGTVAITSSSTTAGADVLRIAGDGVTLRGLTIGVQPGGGSALTITGAGTVVETSTIVDQAAGGADVPAVEVLAPTGTTTLRNAIVVHAPDLAAPGGAPAIAGPAASALLLEGTQAVAGPESGPAVAAAGPVTTIVRSGLLALNPQADALRVTSAADSPGAKQATVDSSVLAGGTGAAGLRAESLAGPLPGGSQAGPVDVDLVHATIAGAARSVVIDAAANSIGLAAEPTGAVDVRAERSIVHGAASVSNYDGVLLDLLGAANTAALTIADSDTDVQPSSDSGSTVTTSGTTTTPASALFADAARRVYLLRPDAPVRDRGGPLVGGESDKDLEGEPRLEGAATDLGADEFHNKAPVARLAAPATVKQGQAVTLDASGSADPEGSYGGGIKEYRFDFGDGRTEVSASPQAQHTYADVGSYQPTVTVVDVFGATSATARAAVQVTDGVAPAVRIAQPRRNATLALRETRRVTGKNGKVRKVRRARRQRFQGTAQDASGVQMVELSFRFGSATGRTCRFLDARRQRIVGRPCGKPLFFRVALRDGIWAYRTKPGAKLRRGRYVVTARATDASGQQASHALGFRLR